MAIDRPSERQLQTLSWNLNVLIVPLNDSLKLDPGFNGNLIPTTIRPIRSRFNRSPLCALVCDFPGQKKLRLSSMSRSRNSIQKPNFLDDLQSTLFSLPYLSIQFDASVLVGSPSGWNLSSSCLVSVECPTMCIKALFKSSAPENACIRVGESGNGMSIPWYI
jgi:hypothetical protein